MKKYILYLILSVVLLFTASGCIEKITYRDKEIEIEKEKYWNHYLFFDPIYNFITNGLVVDEKFIISNYYRVMVFDDLTITPSIYGGSNVTVYNFKSALSKEISAHRDMDTNSNQVTFCRHRQGSPNWSIMYVEQFGEQFKNYRFKQNYMLLEEIGAFNSKNRFVTIISYYFPKTGIEINDHIVFVDLDPHGQSSVTLSDFGYYEIPSVKLAPQRRWLFSNIISYNEKFYVGFIDADNGSKKRYLEILEDHTIREFIYDFPEPIYSLFEFKGFLFAQTYRSFTYTSDGENWTLTSGPTSAVSNLRDIKGYLFFSYSDQIYFIEAVDDNLQDLSLYRVRTDNIAGRTISSINKFKDDLVITTSSGIFYKSFTEVIDDAKVEKTNAKLNNKNKIYIQ